MSFLKELVRVKDRLLVKGGVSSSMRGIRQPDGSPVPVEVIMREFGVSREQAEEIADRSTR